MPFPLSLIPELSYKTAGRKFGAPRDGGKRKHAGCDLIAKLGTEIYAIDDGVVLQESKDFYHGTNSLVVQHRSGIVVRYCEILKKDEVKLERGAVVKAGDLIAHVGKMHVDSMLHFELYSGQAFGELTQRNNGAFQRRSDLVDPTDLLDKLALEFRAAHPSGAKS